MVRTSLSSGSKLLDCLEVIDTKVGCRLRRSLCTIMCVIDPLAVVLLEVPFILETRTFFSASFTSAMLVPSTVVSRSFLSVTHICRSFYQPSSNGFNTTQPSQSQSNRACKYEP